LTFTGPGNIAGGIPAVVTKTGTPAGHALPWSVATTRAGQIRFYDATPTEINFYGRRPYLVEFNVPARVTRQFTLTVNPAGGPALGIATAALPDGVQNRPYRFRLQHQGGTGPYNWTTGGGTNLPAGVNLLANGTLQGTPTNTGNFTLVANLQDSTGTTVTANLAFTIAADAGGLAFQTAAVLPAADAGLPYETILTTKGGTAPRSVAYARKLLTDVLPAGMTLAADGTLQWNNPVAGAYTFDVDVVDSQVRGLRLVGVHAPPDGRYPNNAAMVENLAQILEITTNRGGVPTVVCGDFNVCPLAATPNTCYDRKHKQREVDALDGLTANLPLLQRFTSQNANRRTGLKSAAKAAKDAYAAVKPPAVGALIQLDHLTSHAYDHVLTIGFAGVNNVGTANLVAEDPGFANAQAQAQGGNHHPVAGLVKKYLWSSGVSDHYPVRFTLVV
jgi:hypothetical protein